MMSDNYLDRFDEDAKNPKHHHLDRHGPIAIVGANRSNDRIVALAHQIAANSPLSFDHAIVELRKLENQPLQPKRDSFNDCLAAMAPMVDDYQKAKQAHYDASEGRPSNATKKGFNPRDKNKAKQARKSRKRNRK